MLCEGAQHEASTHLGSSAFCNLDLLGAIAQTTGTARSRILRRSLRPTLWGSRRGGTRGIVERESQWQACAVSPKGAAGLMQLMPLTAQRLGARDRCSVDQNVSGGVRHLAWLMQQFHNDFRLLAAPYYPGQDIIVRRDRAL